MPNSKTNQPILWGLLHGLNDFTAGYMLANYTFNHNNESSFLFIIIYSIIGFGGQLPVGFWLDHKKDLPSFAKASVILLPLAIALFFVNAETGIIFSGLASAFVHVTGGAICLQVNDNKTGPLALFTAPGVLGLTFGGLLGSMSSLWLLLICLVILLIAFFILKEKLPDYPVREKKQSELDGHDWLMLGILLIMCFRSFVFDVLNHVAQDFEHGILIIGLSAFAGKIIGGFVADKIGWKKYVYISLPLALILLQFGKENIYALAFGIACLQSSVPITLMLMGQSLSLYPATATALSLGTSIALAGLPLYMAGSKSTIITWFGNGKITATAFCLLLIIFFLFMYFISRIRRHIKV
ncbi:MAG: hypothetical protein ABJA78_09025 [Ferruginibacter sp.]